MIVPLTLRQATANLTSDQMEEKSKKNMKNNNFFYFTKQVFSIDRNLIVSVSETKICTFGAKVARFKSIKITDIFVLYDRYHIIVYLP